MHVDAKGAFAGFLLLVNYIQLHVGFWLFNVASYV